MRRVTWLGLISCLFLLPCASARPVIWTFQNVQFDDGGSLTGYFFFDADTGSGNGVSIVTTPGTVSNAKGGPLAGFTYSRASMGFDTRFSPTLNIQFDDVGGNHVIFFDIGSSLTNAGGSIPIITGPHSGNGSYETSGPIAQASRRDFISGSISGTVAQNLTITIPSILPSGSTGVFYSQTLTASGGVTPYTWVLSGALPSGLALSSSGAITGIPSVSGTFNFAAQVNDSTRSFLTQSFTLTIAAPNLITITTPLTLPSGSPGVFYSQTLTASGGSPPYAWSLTSGALPSGLTLANSGAITGTPTSAGTLTFTARVTDSASSSATQNFTLTISAGLSITTASTLPPGTTGIWFFAVSRG